MTENLNAIEYSKEFVPGSLKRKRYTITDKIKIIEEFKQNSMSFREFAELKGISHPNLVKWDKNLEI